MILFALLCIALLLHTAGLIGELCSLHSNHLSSDQLQEVPSLYWSDILDGAGRCAREIQAVLRHAFPHAEQVVVWSYG